MSRHRPTTSRPLRAALAVVVGVLGVAACGSPPPGTGASAVTATPTSETTSTASSHSSLPPSSSATSSPSPTSAESSAPLVATATWVRGSGGRSLHVVPTAAGRVAQGATDAARAWAEVLRIAPDADQPGMQAQFDCHWTYARLVQPDKPSWNLEPWRPVVSDQQMVDARCNPGGPESADG